MVVHLSGGISFCSEASEFITFAIKTKVLLCITFLEDFSSHLTDTLITLKPDMQTQFWFKTLIVYTYSIIFYHFWNVSCIHMPSSVSCRIFFVESTYTTQFVLEVMCGILALFGLQEGKRQGKKQTHVMSDHMVNFFAFYGVKKHHFGCKTQGCCWMKGNVFDVNRSLVVFVGIFLETSKQQAEVCWLKHSKPSVFASSCRCLWRTWFLTRFHKASKRWFVLYVNADMALFWNKSIHGLVLKVYYWNATLTSPTFNMVMNTSKHHHFGFQNVGKTQQQFDPWEFLRWKRCQKKDWAKFSIKFPQLYILFLKVRCWNIGEPEPKKPRNLTWLVEVWGIHDSYHHVDRLDDSISINIRYLTNQKYTAHGNGCFFF